MNAMHRLFRQRAGFAVVLLAVAAGGTAQAQTLDFGSCVRIEDLSARLACYDRAAGRPTTPAASAAMPAPAPAPTPMPAPAPAAVVAPVVPASPTASFGATERPDALTAKRPETAPEEVKQIEARVAAVRKRLTGEYVLTLDNGQVWEQTERRLEPQYAVGDTVVIRRGVLGSFILTLAKGSPSTRARRIS